MREHIYKKSVQTLTQFRSAIIVVALIVAPFVLTISFPSVVHANTSCSPNGIMSGGSGSDWLNGAGVNVCNNGSNPDNDYGNNCVAVTCAPGGSGCSAGYVLSGEEWQCVELVNRLYLANGWITTHWSGNGDTLIDNLPSSLSDNEQANGSISYINPGDVITLNYGSDGHAAIINSVSGSTYSIINQNVPRGVSSSAYITSGTSLSAGNAFLHMNSWPGYTVQAIVHAPTTNNVYENAFQTNTGYLFTYNSLNGTDPTTQGMMSGTNPSMAALSNGTYEIAFQNNTGYLYVYNTGTGLTQELGTQTVASGTSPSITALPGGGWEIAYQHGDGNLYTYNSSNGAQAYSLGMASGTSPSITALSSSSFEVAFQANTGNLYVYSNNNGAHNLGDGMGSGTSPSISTLTSSAWQLAFQSNSNNLNVYNSANGWTPFTLGMQAGTSPSITTLTSSAYEVAFQNNTNYLWVYNNSNGANTTGDGMQSGTIPSIVASSSSAYQIAFQNNGDYLYDYNFNNGTVATLPTTQGMLSTTSPAASIQ